MTGLFALMLAFLKEAFTENVGLKALSFLRAGTISTCGLKFCRRALRKSATLPATSS